MRLCACEGVPNVRACSFRTSPDHRKPTAVDHSDPMVSTHSPRSSMRQQRVARARCTVSEMSYSERGSFQALTADLRQSRVRQSRAARDPQLDSQSIASILAATHITCREAGLRLKRFERRKAARKALKGLWDAC